MRLRPRCLSAAWAALATVVVLTGSCTGREAAAPLPPSPPEIGVALREWAVDVEPGGGELPKGRFVFRVRNAGGLDHELSLSRIPAEVRGTLAEQLRSSQRVSAPALVRLRARPPGATALFAVELTPGRYGLLCLLQDDGGTPHAKKGMVAELRVR